MRAKISRLKFKQNKGKKKKNKGYLKHTQRFKNNVQAEGFLHSLYYFPQVAITSSHKVDDLKQQKLEFLSWRSG